VGAQGRLAVFEEEARIGGIDHPQIHTDFHRFEKGKKMSPFVPNLRKSVDHPAQHGSSGFQGRHKARR
jgi:hypothetical protein